MAADTVGRRRPPAEAVDPTRPVEAARPKGSAQGRRRPHPALFRAALALAAALGAANLLAGLGGGLARLGWPVPAAAMADHGAVMIAGFFGTVIALERAVALRRGPGLLVPLAAGLGGVAVWGLAQPGLGAALWGLSSLGLAGLYLFAGLTRAWSLHLRVELGAALVGGLGTLAWALGAPRSAELAWMAFLVGTIAGERRELMQFVRLGSLARRAFGAMLAAGLTGLALVAAGEVAASPVAAAAGTGLWWLACGALALWLLRWDLAPRLAGRPGWPGHTGRCLTVGYAWLLVAAVLGLWGLSQPGSPAAALARHALLLGFVFAMVFGHAPIILPALGAPRPRPLAAATWPLWLLALSLLARGAAAVTGSPALLAWAGAGHALAIAAFALLMLAALSLGPGARPGPAPAGGEAPHANDARPRRRI